jgi:predicted HicB family RNase H-like nuclease
VDGAQFVIKNVFTLMTAKKSQMENEYIKEEKKNNLVPSLMGFEKQFNLNLVSRTHKLVNQDLLARNAIYN